MKKLLLHLCALCVLCGQIQAASLEAEGPAPEIDYTPDDFWLKFPFRSDYVAATITEPTSVKTPVKILKLLLTNKSHHTTGKNKPLITG